jgi:hypothetical protein
MSPGKSRIHGLMAEFSGPKDLIEAAHQVHEAGYRDFDAYSPYPIEELTEAMGIHHNRVPLVVLLGGIMGLLGGFSLQYFTAVIDYPLNIGGRPLFSWPSFFPVTFECTVLVAGLCAVFGMLAMNGLPMPYHPVFNVPRFALASRDRFFLCIEASDPKFDPEKTRGFLSSLKAQDVVEVEP